MPPHLLGNKRRVAGEQQEYGRNARTCRDLSSLENLAAVNGIVRSQTVRMKLDFGLCVLAATKARVLEKLLDCIVKAPEEEDQALTAVQGLSEISPLNAFRHVLVYGSPRERAHSPVPHLLSAEFRAGYPLEQPIAVWLTHTAPSVRGHDLCLLTIEPWLPIAHPLRGIDRAVELSSWHPSHSSLRRGKGEKVGALEMCTYILYLLV